MALMIWQKVVLNVLNKTLAVIASINITTKPEGIVEINPVEYYITKVNGNSSSAYSFSC